MKKVISLFLSFVMLISVTTGLYLNLNAYAGENDVASISYTPVEEKVIVENTNGYLTTDYNENEYYYYYTGIDFGDKLTVTYKNGTVVDYVYGYDEEGYSQFVSEDGQIIDWDDINYYNDQYENHWTLGLDNGYYVEYLGHKAYVPVTIIENPVSSISYTPAEEKVIVENTNGYLTTDYNENEYYYYCYTGIDFGDKLTVTYKNGTVVDYVYGYDEEGYSQFVSEDGQIIDWDDIICYEDQYENHWTLGSDNGYYVEYLGNKAYVPVTITENPVSSISYTPAEAKVIVENTNGYLTTDYNENEYYHYYYTGIDFGDKLTVTYKNETVVDYVYGYDEEGYSQFVSEDGQIIDWDDINYYNDQYEDPWTLGSDNGYYVEYLGHKAYVPVTIIENPVSSISYTPAEEKVIVENTNGYLTTDYNENEYYYYYTGIDFGDKLTVTYKNGTVVDYVYGYDEEGYSQFVSEDGQIIDWDDIICYEDQYENHWTLGSDNGYYVEYLGHKAYVQVKIVCKVHPGTTIVGAKSATCTGMGYTGDFVCSACGELIGYGRGINATGHNFGNNSPVCLNCGISNPNYVDPTPPDPVPGTTTTAPTQPTTQAPTQAPTQPITQVSDDITTTTAPAPQQTTTQVSDDITTTTNSAQTTTTTAATTVKKPKSTSISKLTKGKKQFKVTWKKVSSISGYQIQYSTDKKFKKNVKNVTAKKSSTSATIKNLKSKKTYYVRVRTYKTVKVNGKSTKVYSSWSKVKSVKTK